MQRLICFAVFELSPMVDSRSTIRAEREVAFPLDGGSLLRFVRASVHGPEGAMPPEV